jgi:hypothetical protein
LEQLGAGGNVGAAVDGDNVGSTVGGDVGLEVVSPPPPHTQHASAAESPDGPVTLTRSVPHSAEWVEKKAQS